MANRVRVPSTADLALARDVVRRHLVPSPVIPAPGLGDAVLKLETVQPTGSFKVRGALVAANAVDDGTRVVTASAGNHGLGMAFAAAALGREVTVVVPENASRAKVSALRAFPVEVVRHGDGYDDAERHALALAAESGVFVSAYNDVDVIAGQSTIAGEVAAQVAGPVTLVCGVGGGGLCAGLSLWAADREDMAVVGVEAEASRAVSAAVRAGRRVPVPVGATLADGLAGNLDDPCVTFGVIGAHAERLLAVSEDEIRAAMRWLFRHHGLVVEGSGAVGVAAALAGKLVPEPGRTTVFVLTGRNVSADVYRDVLGS
ncbi:threonine ammonia-lyase [Umezawaea tangerina]|uniref:Threonine dehydratase n=1 Tax=Umezawaea tangerina TaxID=84725 RepID=A0A2T0T2B9_9PSEU|nr:pyridoxal-phosphate dependent enzyme [Umezawaea tangerina]PRY39796.1 threonine dehydratase [Umezawaea tangerina]